jgi:hypothetical protein
LIGAIVDTEALAQVVLYALIAGVGITLVFAVAVYGATRSTDMRRAGSRTAATLFAIVGATGAAATLAALAYGVYLITQKS